MVVKIMYDRGSWEQLWNSHAPVKPEGWTPLDLPGQDDVPGLDMEVIVSRFRFSEPTNGRTFTECCSAPSTPSSSSLTGKSP